MIPRNSLPSLHPPLGASLACGVIIPYPTPPSVPRSGTLIRDLLPWWTLERGGRKISPTHRGRSQTLDDKAGRQISQDRGLHEGRSGSQGKGSHRRHGVARSRGVQNLAHLPRREHLEKTLPVEDNHAQAAARDQQSP